MLMQYVQVMMVSSVMQLVVVACWCQLGYCPLEPNEKQLKVHCRVHGVSVYEGCKLGLKNNFSTTSTNYQANSPLLFLFTLFSVTSLDDILQRSFDKNFESLPLLNIWWSIWIMFCSTRTCLLEESLDKRWLYLGSQVGALTRWKHVTELLDLRTRNLDPMLGILFIF